MFASLYPFDRSTEEVENRSVDPLSSIKTETNPYVNEMVSAGDEVTMGRHHFVMLRNETRRTAVELKIAASLLAILLACCIPLLMAAPASAAPAASPPPHGASPTAGFTINGYLVSADDREVPEGLKAPRYPFGVPGLYLVQLTGPVREEWKDALLRLGAGVGDYLPENAFIVRMDSWAADLMARLSFVRYVGAYHPAYKVDRSLLGRWGGTEEILIRLFNEEDVDRLLATLEEAGGQAKDRSGRLLTAYIPHSAVIEIARDPNVQWMQRVPRFVPLNSRASWVVQSGEVDQTPIWAKGLHGEGQIVGEADTGVDWDHEAFFDPDHEIRYTDPESPLPPDLQHRKIVNYWTYVDDHDLDYSGHGTHVGCTIAGHNLYLPGNSGNPNGLGVAYRAKLSFSDIGGSGDSLTLPSDLGTVFQWQYGDGARIHSDSWGGSGNRYDDYSRQLDTFTWNHKDFLPVFANGNSGPWGGTVGTPAAAKNVVSVGATVNGQDMNDLAYFSSHGPTADGRLKPTVCAPGDSLVSADSDGDLTANNSGYVGMRGTSMATPVTSGALALIRQYFMEGWYPSGVKKTGDALTPSAALLKADLMVGSVEMTGGYTDYQNEKKYPNYSQGWGRILLDNSLYFQGDSVGLWVVDETTGIQTAGEAEYTLNVTDTSLTLKVVLVWTDYPGNPAASKALVNDLDLRVTAPSGKVYLGNVFTGLDPGRSATGGVRDDTNVEEGVILPPGYGLEPGSYKIEVLAPNVPEGPQPYAVAAIGGFGVPAPNRPPQTPTTPSGPSSGTVGTTYTYGSSASDPDGDRVQLTFDWGDNSTTTTEPVDSGVNVTASHSWSSAGTYQVKTIAADTHGAESGWSTPLLVSISEAANNPPKTPTAPSGPASGLVGTSYVYSSAATDPDNDQVQLRFDWGDGSNSTTGYVDSGAAAFLAHTWTSAGTYKVKVKAIDAKGAQSDWSTDLTVAISAGGEEAITVVPSENAAGWVRSDEPDGNHFGDDDIYAGAWGEYIYLGAVQFNVSSLPSGATITSVTLTLVGQTRDYMGTGGSWHCRLLTSAVDQNWPKHGYTVIHDAEVLATIPPTFGNSDLDANRSNTFTFTSEQLGLLRSRSAASFRMDGPTEYEFNVFSWDSGYGQGGLGIKPKLTITYTRGNVPPVADADGPYNGTVGNAITFDGSGSRDPDGELTSYFWQFGDGETGYGETVTHAYSSQGTYLVSLTVTDNADASSTDTTEAIVLPHLNQPPTADAGGPYSGAVGEPIKFDGSGSHDPDGEIVSYAWQFGDGSSAIGVRPIHAYEALGLYTVTLTVTDDLGATDTASTTAEVMAGELTITITPQPGHVGWVSSRDPYTNWFTDDDIYAGVWSWETYHGAVQFSLSSLPANATIISATLTLTGQTRDFMGTGGSWHCRLLTSAVDQNWPNHNYLVIHNAEVAATIPPTLINSDLDANRSNTFTFTSSQLQLLVGRATASLRLDGLTSYPFNVFSWDSGYGQGGLGIKPKLTITYQR